MKPVKAEESVTVEYLLNRGYRLHEEELTPGYISKVYVKAPTAVIFIAETCDYCDLFLNYRKRDRVLDEDFVATKAQLWALETVDRSNFIIEKMYERSNNKRNAKGNTSNA